MSGSTTDTSSRSSTPSDEIRDRESQELDHRERRRCGCHALRYARDARTVLDRDFAHRPPAPAQSDEDLRLEEVAPAPDRDRAKVGGAVELHAVDVLHR